MPDQPRQPLSSFGPARIGMLAAAVLLAAVAVVVWWTQSGSESANSDPTPGGQAETPAHVDLAAPLDPALGDTGPLLHLRMEPAAPGENAVAVFATEPVPVPGQEPVRRPFAPETAAELAFTPLNTDQSPTTTTLTANDTGEFGTVRLDVTPSGWWKVDVLVRPPTGAEMRQSFYVLLPDPNVHGSAAVEPPTSESGDGDATAVFERGLATLTGLHRLRYEERLADGNGHLVIGRYALSDGSDGRPPGLSIESARTALIRIGDREWLRRGDGQWTERTAATVFVPADFGETYAGATDLRLGRTEEIDGEVCRIVTFYVPDAPRRAEAWYAWWVGEESGFVRQETMVARSHYMVHRYGDFDAEFAIEPPAGAPASPQPANGTPVAALDQIPSGAILLRSTAANRTTSRHKSFTGRR